MGLWDGEVLRKSAKKRWLELQKEKEKGVTRAVPEGHKDRKRLLDEQQGPAKVGIREVYESVYCIHIYIISV